MEQRLLKVVLIQLRVAAALLVGGILTVLILSFSTARLADDIWGKLGLPKDQGTEYIGSGFLEGYFSYYGARNLKNIATGNRADIVKGLGDYAREYVNSEKFRQQYLKHREGLRPQPPAPAKTAAEVRAQQVGAVNESIKAMEGFAKNTNADLKKMAEENLPELRKQLKDIERPDNELIKLIADAEKTNFEMQTQRHAENLAKWEKEFPVDPKHLVKKRLVNFLELTSDIDFNAELKEKNGHKVFVNTAYERKSDDWKRAFRAGREAVTAARTFAQNWLNELK
jgi:hypothetical protein